MVAPPVRVPTATFFGLLCGRVRDGYGFFIVLLAGFVRTKHSSHLVAEGTVGVTWSQARNLPGTLLHCRFLRRSERVFGTTKDGGLTSIWNFRSPQSDNVLRLVSCAIGSTEGFGVTLTQGAGECCASLWALAISLVGSAPVGPTLVWALFLAGSTTPWIRLGTQFTAALAE